MEVRFGKRAIIVNEVYCMEKKHFIPRITNEMLYIIYIVIIIVPYTYKQYFL